MKPDEETGEETGRNRWITESGDDGPETGQNVFASTVEGEGEHWFFLLGCWLVLCCVFGGWVFCLGGKLRLPTLPSCAL
jgi:hypothetical protein